VNEVLGIALANPAGLWLLALAVPIVVLHVLRPRRARHEVRSVLLWRQVSSPVSAASPWQRLVPSTLLLLQLLAVLLLAVAVARPVQAEATPLAARTVFVIDASASMGAREGTEARIDLAARRARDLFDDLPDGGVASVVEAGSTARVTVNATDDVGAFAGAVDAIDPTEGTADLSGAFALARSLETPGVPIGFVLLSDGGLDAVSQRQIPAGTRYEPVGQETTNRAIRGLTVETRGSALHVIATVAHTGGPPATQTLRFDVDGRTEHTAVLELADGAVTEVEAEVPSGARVEAFLEGEDALDLDDHAYATAPPVHDLTVVVIGPPDPFLEILLGSLPGVTMTTADSVGAVPGADVVVLNQVPVPDDLQIGHWAIAPPTGTPQVSVTGESDRAAVTLLDSRDPLLDGLDLSDLAVARTQLVDAPLGTELIGTESTPLLVRGDAGGAAFVYQTFAVGNSNLPVQVAFPILGDRILRELAGPGAVAQSLTVGDVLPTEVASEVEVRRPGGAVVERPPGSGTIVADRAGFWSVSVDGAEPVLVAVNPAATESDLAVAPSLPIPEPTRPDGDGDDLAESQRSLLVWIVVPLLVVLAVEWWASRRRLGVSRRQWRLAVAARVLVAALLLTSLAGLAVDRASDRVATVFLLDASDSLGDGGRQGALAWIDEAVRAQPDGSLAGLAVFGGDAQIETTMRTSLSVTRPAVRIDPSRTDLAGALRLASAVLPTDARRRVVLVSDGRPTQGDLLREAERLGDAGIVVEFHAVGHRGGRDVAVAELQLPDLVRQGEEIALVATLHATDPGPARIDVLRDGAQVDSRTVELVEGPNEVTFTTVAEGTGVARYQLRVTAGGDSIAQNDVAFGATRIEGPATVLVVEGRPGAGATLAAALDAAGIAVETVPVTQVPPLDELAGVASTVLVDVDARSLAPEHLDALTAATRDLGRGLVTVGGTQSYGLGGYRGTELEALLPVESEILDPERRQTVAEVLAIDTSGSMGACHCAEGNNGVVDGNSMVQGGVNKTDISRAGAARAIQALSEIDEVGVLAIDTQERWLIDLQQLPAEEVVTSGLRNLVASENGTDLSRSLQTSAEALRDSDAALKHVILFTDGFTQPFELDGLADDAAALLEEGITVSVVATGEGAAEQLGAIASAGGGRFYPGRDLQEVPEIIAEEAVLASREFIQEGQFLPQRTSAADPVAGLTEVPPVLGYVATTARPLATTHLRVGEEADPLLSSWQVGLGRATSWTSDLDRWGRSWADWPGFVDFWAAVVKDTYATGERSGAVRASIDGDVLQVEVEASSEVPGGATGTARVVQPDGEVVEIPLTRSEGDRFVGQTTVTRAGSYAVGATVGIGDSVATSGTALATRSYSAEYVPGDVDLDVLTSISARTGGRGAIEPVDAFHAEGLVPGRHHVALTGWILLAAALCWPLAVALSRLTLRAGGMVGTALGAGAAIGRRVRDSLPSRPGGDLAGRGSRTSPPPPEGGRRQASEPGTASGPVAPPPPTTERPAPAAPRSTLDSLLESKRQRRGPDGP
jgi:Mg-chelatase subunit ChlD